MSINLTIVYFLYGLAFFSMGLAMLLESNRSPILAEIEILKPLALFGLVHGTHEWLEMFLAHTDWFVAQFPLQLSWLRISLLTISFLALIIFGARILKSGKQLSPREAWLRVYGPWIYAALALILGIDFAKRHADLLLHFDVMIRYLLGVTGAALAGWGLHAYATSYYQQGRRQLGRSLRWASLGFTVYAFTQTVVPKVDAFPANAWNTSVFLLLTGFPIQVLRAAMAALIMVSLLRAIQLADEERQRLFRVAQQSRQEALENLKRELETRDEMRQELLRHTVIAQEEERARIARELHDETAQVLTAFSLHIAALRNEARVDLKNNPHLLYLSSLSRQMSEEIHRLVSDLRPAQLDDLGLVSALRYLTDETNSRTGLQVDLSVQGEPRRLDSLIETVCFRVAQEALTNVARHAGVDSAQLELIYEADHILLRVSDQGVGFSPEQLDPTNPKGWGLAGIRERVGSVGGTLHLRSERGLGTVVEIIIPVLHEVVNANHSLDVGG